MNKTQPVKKIKQISYLSAIVVIIGSTVGAGIFVKNSSLLSLTQGRIPFVVVAWTIAGVAMICLGIALFELSSVAKGNGGVLEWTRAFLPNWFHKGAAKYLAIFFYPATIFSLSFYFVQEIEDTGHFHLSGWIVALIAFCVAMWTTLTSGASLAFGEKVQWIVTLAKFLPLTVLPFLAYAGNNGPAFVDKANYSSGFAGFSPWVGLIATIPAITFAYDGIYRAASLRNNMKSPSHAPKAMIVSVVSITIFYFFFSTSFLFATKSGTFADLKIGVWLVIFKAMICASIFGVLNGYVIASPNVIQSLWEVKELWQPKVLAKFTRDRLGATFFTLAMTIVYFMIFVPIGIYAYDAPLSAKNEFGNQAAGLYALANLFTNWSAMVIFTSIAISIIGAMVNRRTKRVDVKRYKPFIWTAPIAVTYILGGFSYMFIEQIIDMTGFNGADNRTAILTFMILIVTLSISFFPSIYELLFKKKRTIISNNTKI